MHKLFALVTLLFCSMQFVLGQDQATILDKIKLSKVSVPDHITEQMITQTKESGWVFLTQNIQYYIGEGDATMLKVLTYSYDNVNSTYLFVCTGKDGKRFNVQFKKSEPVHVLIQEADGKGSLFCHN